MKDQKKWQLIGAWSIHLFTASGAVWGFLALVAIIQKEWVSAAAWMAIAIFVDSVDGTLSRLFRVKQTLPGFDGALLDNIIDYQTYVVVPALFVFQAQLVPPAILLPLSALILLASGYQFAQADAKTEDHFFKGFPSYWNVVVVYLFFMGTAPLLNLIVLLLCAVMVFIPVKYVYPSRTTKYRRLTLTLTAVWFLTLPIAMIQYPAVQPWVAWLSFLYIAYYIGMSLFLTKHSALAYENI
ncbi:MAG: CDP-alcohol phosphatidyltransferase family protein [Ardenticatenaceae bacterium]|nr:CDP-alcohol phosphatidyltransferase family protein [Ardenticatenaceae bacterium]MCB9444446.1 CDP-alcohol phosphatidyltransferase family protein [Ardenticatenaceae bacterium]